MSSTFRIQILSSSLFLESAFQYCRAVEFGISGFKQKIVAKKHGVDIGFAITSWKAQGRTLPKVVLHMNAALGVIEFVGIIIFDN